MNNRIIGRIVTINNNVIIAELFNNLGNYVNVYDGIRFVGEIGSYVAIDDINRRIICEITAVDEKNESSSDNMSRTYSNRYLRLGLIGEIFDNSFHYGVTKMPSIFSEIKIITEKDLGLMLDITENELRVDAVNTKLKALPIGKSVNFPDYDVKIKINEFFGFHFAIFGNTGAGKSNTIARLIQNIFSKTNYSAKGARFVIFDSNGEYEAAFKEITANNSLIKVKNLNASNNQDSKLEIPVWALTVDDWAILLHATEKTQIPIIRRALELINTFDSDNDSENSKIVKNHILATVVKDILTGADSPSSKSDKIASVLKKFRTDSFNLDFELDYSTQDEPKGHASEIKFSEAISISFGKMKALISIMNFCEKNICPNFKELISEKKTTCYTSSRFLEAVELAIVYEGSVSSNRIYEYTSTLVTRLQHLIESEQGRFFQRTEFDTIEKYINNLMGDNQIINIDVSSLDDTATEVISKVLSKLLFDYVRSLRIRNTMPINLILEEAHRYVKETSYFGALDYNIFERIAKEGRKFGLLLGLSSQRPSELSKTVVSQCSNFIIHRIQNPDDIHYISRMVPYINQSIIDRITYLRRGNALVFGTAINLPTITMFEMANPTPNSENPNISELWYKE